MSSLGRRGWLVVGGALMAACGSVGDPLSQTGADAGDPGGADAAIALGDVDRDGVADAIDRCPTVADPGQLDGDGDDYGDACDCAPADAAVAADLVLADALATDSGKFAPATGFTAGNWAYADGAYRQTSLVDDGEDAALLTGVQLGDVFIEVTGVSTQVADFDATDLRQLTLIARAAAAAGSFSALGCGIEVVEGLTPTTKTSALAFAGSPDQVTTSPTQRTDRAGVAVDEEFVLRLVLRGGTLTCTAVLDGVDTTTATATGLAPASGQVGFLTRETAAAFKNLKVCSYR